MPTGAGRTRAPDQGGSGTAAAPAVARLRQASRSLQRSALEHLRLSPAATSTGSSETGERRSRERAAVPRVAAVGDCRLAGRDAVDARLVRASRTRAAACCSLPAARRVTQHAGKDRRARSSRAWAVAGVPLGKCPASSRTRCDSNDHLQWWNYCGPARRTLIGSARCVYRSAVQRSGSSSERAGSEQWGVPYCNGPKAPSHDSFVSGASSTELAI